MKFNFLNILLCSTLLYSCVPIVFSAIFIVTFDLYNEFKNCTELIYESLGGILLEYITLRLLKSKPNNVWK